MNISQIIATVQRGAHAIKERADKPIGNRPVFEAIDALAKHSSDPHAILDAIAAMIVHVENITQGDELAPRTVVEEDTSAIRGTNGTGLDHDGTDTGAGS